ncbi:uncharacterized protein LOC124257145 [Haliotis rubra]|uniref:uncharacterized protein LOC124257145 n=1 Tax=Haliotis rubra TaxID=36100 RepID=UPI001EE60C68|nr:uncharacterized protein LOC124257145 [Haliotis rubra]
MAMAAAPSGAISQVCRSELENNGYCVINDVVSHTDCDELISQYKSWLNTFEDHDWPNHRRSIIYQYRIGHFGATWSARLKVKPVFSSLWKTDKLLTSFDSVAISRPPEETDKVFDNGQNWFHIDQKASREGLHCYQGALYLEESTENDFCFRALKDSHKYHNSFFDHYKPARAKSLKSEFYKLTTNQVSWFRKKKCKEVKVAVPKGGMVLWDSRLIHDNVPPVANRPNADRWRFVVFVSMTPAIWAAPRDIALKRRAYSDMLMTNHWPSQSLEIVQSLREPSHSGKPMDCIDNMPEVAQTEEAMRLAGVLDYDFENGKSNGPKLTPVWNPPRD